MTDLPSPLREEDYGAIEAAVMETARGRWFLQEYARRNRHADTLVILATLDRLERVIRRERASPETDRLRLDLAEMAQAIDSTKQEIADLKGETAEGGRFARASLELEALASDAERATNDILGAAEAIEDIAFLLEQAGTDPETAAALKAQTTRLYTACAFHDLTGQRTRKVVRVLDYLEERIAAMMAIWAADGMPAGTRRTGEAGLDDGPALSGEGNDQATIDLLVEEVVFREAEEPLEDPADHQILDLADDEDDLAFAVRPAADATVSGHQPAAAAGREPPVLAPALPPGRPEAGPGRQGEVVDETITAEADVFAFTPPAPARSSPVPRPAALAAPPPVIGATALALDADPSPAAEAAPALAVIPLDDPLASYDSVRRLLVFG